VYVGSESTGKDRAVDGSSRVDKVWPTRTTLFVDVLAVAAKPTEGLVKAATYRSIDCDCG
jgi:hypothetical protein